MSERLPEGSEDARRIVSLVPSLTESLFALGLGGRVVGVTEYCVHPPEALARCVDVGGTKNPDCDRIASLAPDLVIANHEENTRRVVEALQARGLRVWVTYPRTVAEGARLLAEIARLGATPERIDSVLRPVRRAVAEAKRARASAEGGPRVWCPIWKDPWMAVGPDTYAGDLIALCGGDLVWRPEGGSRAPAERRYPVLTQDRIVALDPEVVLLPDEPFAFDEAHRRELAALPIAAARSGRIHCIDGTWVSWYGPRIRAAIEALRPLLLEARSILPPADSDADDE